MRGLGRRVRVVLLVGLAAVCVVLFPAVGSADDTSPGAVVGVAELPQGIWVPGSADAKRLTYWSSGPSGRALSSGAVYLPGGTPPPGGWPVVAWAHGTVGLGDQCAYSVRGPSLPERDYPYLATWLAKGYAIVASDYVGLGTSGPTHYLNGVVEAHSVVDMVKASTSTFPALSKKWVVIGQSQGAGAAMAVARNATSFGGPELDYRGAVATGVPAYIENIVATVGPGVPPVSVGSSLNTYLLFILSGLRATYPELNIDSILTPHGKALVDLADDSCYDAFSAAVGGVPVGSLFTRPLASIPGIGPILESYMGIPESGYDRPFFVGQGLTDVDVPPPTTLALAARMTANNQPLTFRVYPGDHDAAMLASLTDTVPFVERLFA
ncbi:lipase family protein [Antrihabitans sp. YC2-6]|uniref:lipase family protein n=1 Tax=Antrihabitans sp. YC2-6 TaxID=2799498 RepID=UPI0018F42970|nr:lipase family protein [Antrihabitans sp. YC2-6]MBJ8343066.1 lipase [Antrihabitans sp. YC2-6]